MIFNNRSAFLYRLVIISSHSVNENISTDVTFFSSAIWFGLINLDRRNEISILVLTCPKQLFK